MYACMCELKLTRILTRSRNFWRNTRRITRLTSVARMSFRGKSGNVTNPFPSLVKRASFRATFAICSRRSGIFLSSRRHAVRGIPPLVQPLPFATCRRRSVRERILACLRHFSKKRLACSVPRQPDRERQRATSFHYWDYFTRAGRHGRRSSPTRHGDEIPFDLKNNLLLSETQSVSRISF